MSSLAQLANRLKELVASAARGSSSNPSLRLVAAVPKLEKRVGEVARDELSQLLQLLPPSLRAALGDAIAVCRLTPIHTRWCLYLLGKLIGVEMPKPTMPMPSELRKLLDAVAQFLPEEVKRELGYREVRIDIRRAVEEVRRRLIELVRRGSSAKIENVKRAVEEVRQILGRIAAIEPRAARELVREVSQSLGGSAEARTARQVLQTIAENIGRPSVAVRRTIEILRAMGRGAKAPMPAAVVSEVARKSIEVTKGVGREKPRSEAQRFVEQRLRAVMAAAARR